MTFFKYVTMEKCFRLADSIVVTCESDHVLILDDFVDKNERAMIERKMSLILNAADMSRFHPDMIIRFKMRKQYGLENSIIFLCLVGGIRRSHVPIETVHFFLACRRRFPASRRLILTQTPNAEDIFKAAGLESEDYLILSADQEEVPKLILMGDVGLSFLDLRRSASVIKFAEYLASGLPVVINEGQPFIDKLVVSTKTGVIVEEFSEEAYSTATNDLAVLMVEGKELSSPCRTVAEKDYSLESVVQKYAEVYQNVLT